MLFKLEDNVPEVYTTLSRDFLLLCRLYDTLVNSNIIAQLKIRKQLNTKTIDDKLITLLARRLGFKNDEYIPTDVLRNILTLFPYVINNKGNVEGIKYAVISVINAYYNVSDVKVVVGGDILNKFTGSTFKYTGDRIFNRATAYTLENNETLSIEDNIILKAGDTFKATFDIDSSTTTLSASDFIVKIQPYNGIINVELTSDETVDLSYLSEVLKYVVPVGSTVEIIRKTTEVEEAVVEQPATKSTKKKASKSAPIVETVRVNKVKLQTIVRL